MTTGRYEHVLSFALEHPWAVTPAMRAIVAGILARHLAGADSSAEISAALVNRKNLPQPTGGGGVAVIPIYGVIAPRINLMSDLSGGTTFETLTAQLHEALANKAVKTIVFDVDSPGGNVAGATEFAREVMKARTKKPIIAQAQYLMASAAYWPMAGATEIWASPSANVGSIGIYHIHEDVTEALAKLGVKQEVIAAGKYKADAAGVGPLTDEQRGHLKGLIDAAYDSFIGDIAKGRGIQKDAVRNGYGEGRVLNAKDALAAGMIDGISTLNETLARVMSPASADGSRASIVLPDLNASTNCPSCNGSGLKPERYMSDPQGQEKCPTCGGSGKAANSPTVDTPQEPSPATGQDRQTDAHWQNGIHAALLELDL